MQQKKKRKKFYKQIFHVCLSIVDSYNLIRHDFLLFLGNSENVLLEFV